MIYVIKPGITFSLLFDSARRKGDSSRPPPDLERSYGNAMKHRHEAWDELSRLLKTLLQPKGRRPSEATAAGRKRRELLRQMEIHQIELETQNLELQESHQQLERSHKHHTDLYDSSPVGYLTLDERGCIVETNLAGASMLGEERSRLAGKPFTLFITPGETSLFFNHLKQCLSSSKPVTTEVTLVPREKPPITVQLISIAWTDPDRKAKVCRTTLIDCTERKRVEAQLHFQSTLLDQVRNAVIAIGTNQKIVAWSNHAERLFGWMREEALGQDIFDIIIPDENSNAAEEILQKMAETGEWEGEFVVRRRDQSTFPAYFHNAALRGEKGEIIGFVGLGADITERKKIEEALRMREAQLQDAQRLAHIGSWEWDPAEDRVVWSDELYRIWGLNRQEFGATYEDVFKRVHPDDRERLARMVEKARREQAPYVCDHRILHPDGTERILQSRGTVVTDETGRVVKMYGTGQDITERRRAEEALRNAKEFSENLIQTANVIILSLDSDGKIDIFNQAAEKITGYSRSELIGKNWFEILVPRDRYPEVWEEFTRLVTGGPPKTFENPILTKTGEERHILWHNNQVRVDGKVTATISFGNDITEQKQIGQALKESEGRLRMAIHAARMYTWDLEVGTGRLVRSGHHQEVYGSDFSASDGSYTAFLQMIHPEDRKKIERAINRTILKKTPYRADFRIIRPDGDIRWLEAQGQGLHDAEGRLIRLIGVTQDITQRKMTERSLEEYADRLQTLSCRLLEAQEDERRRIARELHDEVGQSLTAIKIQLHAAQRDPATRSSKLEECMRTVDQTVAEIQNLSLNLHPSQLDELGLVAALRWHLDRQASAARLVPHFSADPLPSRLRPDLEIACFRVTQEAITNVIRHARAKKVSVELSYRGTDLSLIIEDDGRGFDVAAARNRALQGTSLGLIGMQERAELAGGRLEWISSPGEGTKVHALFSLADGNPKARPKRKRS